MSKEESINNLKRYIEEDFAFREPLKNLSDFDKFCIGHCKDIETVLNYIKRLEAKIKRYEKYLDNKDKKFKEALENEYQERETDYISKQVIRDKIEELKIECEGEERRSNYEDCKCIRKQIQVLNELLVEE